MKSIFQAFRFKDDPIAHILENLRGETAKMVDILPSVSKDQLSLEILAEAESHLARIKKHMQASTIDPTIRIALSEYSLPQTFYNRVLRIGVYPISANPIHWGHMLVGLSAMAQFKLDKVIFIIAGHDPKKTSLAPMDWRHETSRDVLSLFRPLFEYSNIARNNARDGEANIFKILSLNPFQKMDAFYIAGTDHYYRRDPKRGDKDTVEKLEENVRHKLYNYTDMFHSMSVIFVKRSGGSNMPVETKLNVHMLPRLKFHISSTMIREALCTGSTTDILALLPHTAYQHIMSRGRNIFLNTNPAVLNPTP